MLAQEVTAEAEKCEGVSLVPALELNGKKALQGIEELEELLQVWSPPEISQRQDGELPDSLVPACLCGSELSESRLGPGSCMVLGASGCRVWLGGTCPPGSLTKGLLCTVWV